MPEHDAPVDGAADVWADLPGDVPVDADGGWGEPAPRSRTDILVVPSAQPGRRAAQRPALRAPASAPLGPIERRRLLEAVGVRAREIRVRRRASSVTVMSAAVVLLAVVTLLRSGTSGESTLATGTTSTLTTLPGIVPVAPTAIGSLPPTTATLPALPTLPAPAPTGPVVRIGPPPTTTLRSTTTQDPRPVGDRPDGKPGWAAAAARCDDAATVPRDGGPPDPALSLTVRAPATVRAGSSFTLEITIVNSGPEPVTLTYRAPESRTDAWLLSSADRAASLTLTQGEPRSESVTVPAATVNGGRATLLRSVAVARCGDTSADPMTPLAPTSYLVGAVLDAAVGDTPLAPWRSPQERTVVTA